MPVARTFRLTFAPYSREEFERAGRRLHRFPSVCAFAVLRTALARTKDKPERPEQWKAWKRFAAVQDAFESLEQQAREPVQGLPACPRCGGEQTIEVTYLREQGGALELSEAELDELEAAWHGYLKDGVPKGASQQVAATFAWWEGNVKEVEPATASAGGEA